MSRIVSKLALAASVPLAMALTFSCSPNKEDDGNGGGSNCSADFRTVTIGTQIWMAENLNCNVKGSKCYDNDPGNCNKYGRLYDWATAMGLPSSCNSNSCSGQIQQPHRGICPDGWHIPSSEDWSKLFHYIDGTSGTFVGYSSSTTAGLYLKATSGWNNSGNGTDDYGFSALPGGFIDTGGIKFHSIGDIGFWWIAREYDSGRTYSLVMNYYSDNASWDNDNGSGKSAFSSVRCLQD